MRTCVQNTCMLKKAYLLTLVLNDVLSKKVMIDSYKYCYYTEAMEIGIEIIVCSLLDHGFKKTRFCIRFPKLNVVSIQTEK